MSHLNIESTNKKWEREKLLSLYVEEEMIGPTTLNGDWYGAIYENLDEIISLR